MLGKHSVAGVCIEKCVRTKNAYLDFLKAYEKLHDEYPNDISFTEKRDPICKFHGIKSRYHEKMHS